MSILEEMDAYSGKITKILHQHHIEIIKVCENFLNGNMDDKKFLEFVENFVETHMEIDEKIVIPELKKKIERYYQLIFEGEIHEMNAEHFGIRNLVYKAKIYENKRDYTIELARRIIISTYKEEKIFFGLIEKHTDENDKDRIVKNIDGFLSERKKDFKVL